MANESRTGMKIAALGIGIIIIIAAIAVALLFLGQQGEEQVNPGAPPPEIVQYASDWPLPNKDYSNTRATTDSTIWSGNVAELGLAWSYTIQGVGAFGGAATNPLILGDTVYFQDLRNNVIALNFTTGEVKWSKFYNISAVVGPNGVAVGYGKVFAAKDLYNMTALDINTGQELWSSRISNVSTTGIDIQPVAYGNLVYTSTVPGVGDIFYAPGGKGVIYALYQASGEVEWSFTTVEEDLWGHPEVNSGGGCWYPPAIDTETGTTYWSIANPAPFAGAEGWPSGSSFAGPALYTDTLVALNHLTGGMDWYTQARAHDIFDHDLQISPILASANVSGKQQDLAITAGKMGNVYAMNRDTGAIQWIVPVGTHQNDYLDVLTGPTEVYPGVLGGVETPMAYANGIAYVPVVDLSTVYTPTGLDPTSINFSAGKGLLVAIDAELGKILWENPFDSLCLGGATVVNDLVFTATFDGRIYAFNATTGEEVFTFQAPAGINAWPAVKGDTIIWPAGVGGTPSLIALRLGAVPPGPSVEITSPVEGAALVGPNVTISVDVSNFNLVDKLGQANVAGEGHIHYFMDVDPPTTPGVPAVTDPGTYFPSTATSYTWTNVTNGSHMFSVELINNDHTPLEPAIVAFVNVTVGPRVSIVSPAEDATVVGPNVTISIDVAAFSIVNKLGQPNLPGEGHVHYFMDVDPPTTPGVPAVTAPGTYAATIETSYTWTNVTPGAHMFSVQLVNNDHTPLVPPVVAFVNVTVTEPQPVAVVYLSASLLAFNVTTITVQAGAQVTVIFENLDPGVPHNFAVYTDSTATVVIFQGTLFSGVQTVTYVFDAPTTPGTYFFRCDAHPTTMTGDFIVT